MPGLKKIIGHQTLNSSKSEKSEKKFHWPRWLVRKKKANFSSNQLMGKVSDSLTPHDDRPSQSQSVAGSSKNQEMHAMNMEAIVHDDMVCLLCLQIPKEWFVIEACGCRFCLQCMEMYAHCSVRSGNIPITCPDGLCPLSQHGAAGQLSRNEVRHLVSNDLFPLYLRLQLNTEVAINPILVWCPRPGCETVCNLTRDASQKRSKKKLFDLFSSKRRQRNYSVVCSACHFSFCSQCKTPWHLDAPCPSLSQQFSDPNKKIHELDDPISLLERDGHIKRCPFCQVPIERDDGCAQMMCKNCRHVFCWFCLASLDDDFMLRHYDSGPCRSRLGHSRVSVVWHRTQVVSAFLGLGVLFLVTSPLLLLVSPCFLCWRHHSQSRGASSSSRSNVDTVTFAPASSSSPEHL